MAMRVMSSQFAGFFTRNDNMIAHVFRPFLLGVWRDASNDPIMLKANAPRSVTLLDWPDCCQTKCQTFLSDILFDSVLAKVYISSQKRDSFVLAQC